MTASARRPPPCGRRVADDRRAQTSVRMAEARRPPPCGRRRWPRHRTATPPLAVAAVPRNPGSAYSGQPVTSFRCATGRPIGNGRTPDAVPAEAPRPGARARRPTAPGDRQPCPRCPSAIEVNIPPLPPPLPPVERIRPPQLVVGELGTATDRYVDRPAVRARRVDPDTRRRRRPRLPAGAGSSVAAGVSPYVGPCAGSCPTPTSGSRR